MKKILLVLITIISVGSVFSQTPMYSTNTNPTSGANTIPWSYNSTGCVGQQTYPPGVFGTVPSFQQIKTVYWASATSGTFNYANLDILLKQDNITILTATFETGMTLVYTGLNKSITKTASQYFPIDLDTPFPYDPTLPLIVEIRTLMSPYSSNSSRVYSPTPPGAYRNWATGYTSTTGVSSGAYMLEFGFDLEPQVTVPNNIGVASIDSPTVFCEGIENIVATIQNFGTNQVTSAVVNWSIGGFTQIPVAFSGLLDTNNGTGSQTAQVVLGSYLFGAGIPETIEVWTTLPNGVTDTVTSNDSAVVTVQPSISGNYTIDPLGTGTFNYTTISDAVSDLNSYGVCGPVTFDVAAGTYTEQMTLGQIAGASATNTITFTADTGGVIVEYGASSAVDAWVLKMNQTQYVTIDGFTFQRASSGSTTYTAIVDFNGGSSNNTIKNNTFNFYPSTSSSSYSIGWYTNSAGNDNNTFMNNSFNDGAYYGFYFRGSSTTATNTGNVFDGNSFAVGYYYGLYFYYTTDHTFVNNKVEPASNSSTTGYGYYSYYNYGSLNVSANYFDAYYYGPRIAYNYGTADNRGIIANNMIHTGTGSSTVYGAYFYYNQFTDVVHNTIWADGGPSSSVYGVYLYYGNDNRAYNNVFYRPQGSTGTYGIYCPSTAAYTDVDYNNVWAPGANNSVTGTHDQNTNPGYTKKDSMYTCNDTLDGAGIAFEAVMYDFQGDNRNATTPDIGADEFLAGDSSAFDAGPDGLLCNGNSIEIGTYISGTDYIWNTSETTGKIMVNTIGDYTVSATSACGGAFLDVVTVTDNTPNAVFTYTNSYYTGLFTNTSRTVGDLYRWVFYSDASKNNPMDTIWMSNQKGIHYLFANNEPHNVCLTTYNECDTVEVCNVWTGYVGIDQSNLSDAISLMPNPVSDQLTIQFNNFSGDQINVEMTNVQGQVVYSNQYVNISSKGTRTIDVSNLNKGMYIVKFTSENEVIAKQIIVQ